ncbi:AAA domain-containing protein, partial [Gammaproteobacteria bacterium]|nr:AAA domain-containing protein [Gammaproteobacteria bacterium]
DKYTRTKINTLRSQLKSTDADLKAVTKSKFIYEIYQSNNAPKGKASGRVKEKTEMGLLNHICRKSRTQITMRHMFKQSFNSVTSIKPCTMMSPLTVSQLLPLGDENYDTVIIDEASQMKPEYAIGAMARTKQLIVVGDQKQLPPARDFQSKFNDEDDEDDIVEESILDLALTVLHPARELLFHYRSRHQDLIKFSNAKFYKNLLIPTTASLENKDRGIKHLYLEDATYTTGNTGTGGTNFLEAERAVDEGLDIPSKLET